MANKIKLNRNAIKMIQKNKKEHKDAAIDKGEDGTHS